MAKIEYNQVTPKRTVTLDGDPYIVLDANISKKNRQKASNNARLKNLRTGNVIERTFHQSDVLEEADITKRPVTYLFTKQNEYWFCEQDNPRERFYLDAAIVGPLAQYVTEHSVVDALEYNDEIMSITIPIKVELRVTEAPEAVKGNTSSGATKEVVVETGYKLQAPQFIGPGDVISINTETGDYSERVTKG